MTTTSTVELIEAHPSLLQLETNIRTEEALDAGFLDAIRANGVLTPVLGHRNVDGTVTVRAGQRRVLAACEVGLETVPVYLVSTTDDVEADRIVQQLVENEHRNSMTDVDKVAAYKALELEGLSVTAIAKPTGTKRDVVKTSLTVADSATASTAIQEHALTLDQAAILMDFDGDDEAVARLIQVATTDPAQFAHAAQRARDDRARAQKRQELVDGLTAKGIPVRENRPGYYDKTPWTCPGTRQLTGRRLPPTRSSDSTEHPRMCRCISAVPSTCPCSSRTPRRTGSRSAPHRVRPGRR